MTIRNKIKHKYFVVLNGKTKKITLIFTDDGITGGQFWDVADKSNWGKI